MYRISTPTREPSPKYPSKTSARYEVPSTTLVTPAARARAIWCAVNGTPATGSIGLGTLMVRGRNRVPMPPTSRIASSTGNTVAQGG